MGQGIWTDNKGRNRWFSDPNYRGKPGLVDPPHSEHYPYESVNFETDTENLNNSKFADLMNVPKPTAAESNDSSKMFFYFWFSRIGWLFVLFFCVVGILITTSLVDSGLSTSWSSQGGRRLNDRHVPISSISTHSLRLEDPTFMRDLVSGASVTSTPTIWDGKVFFTTADGKIVALNSKTFEFIWEVDICIGLYSQSASLCSAALDLQMYISVATPTVWGDKLVISVKQPADVLLISQSTGQLIRKVTLDENNYAEITQSGTVWSDSLYIGTSISDHNRAQDMSWFSDCSFTGRFFRINLNNMNILWSKSLVNPNEIVTEGNQHNQFYGIPVKGSSPAVSSKEGLVYITTGSFSCAPEDYIQCLIYTEYDDIETMCHEDPRWKYALFNSIVAFDMNTGHMVWYEKLVGYRTWDMACGLSSEDLTPKTSQCLFGEIDCPFKENKYVNCPYMEDSYFSNFDFTSDPVLQIHSEGKETLYVLQENGIVYSLRAEREFTLSHEHETLRGYNRRFHWATHVFPGTTAGSMGGLAVDKSRVYFTLHNRERNGWYTNDSYHLSYCGGWGALVANTGYPAWYRVHPLCGKNYDYFWRVADAGSIAAPAVSNDALLITSTDRPVAMYDNLSDCFWSIGSGTSSEDFGGHVYLVSTKTGETISSYQTGSTLFTQGFSLHDRCVFVGNGYSASEKENDGQSEGNRMYSWCVPRPGTSYLKPCEETL